MHRPKPNPPPEKPLSPRSTARPLSGATHRHAPVQHYLGNAPTWAPLADQMFLVRPLPMTPPARTLTRKVWAGTWPEGIVSREGPGQWRLGRGLAKEVRAGALPGMLG